MLAHSQDSSSRKVSLIVGIFCWHVYVMTSASLVMGATDSHNVDPEDSKMVLTEDSWPVIITHPSLNIKMGINDEGNLNVAGGIPTEGTGTSNVGLRLIDRGNVFGAGFNAEYESTASGCLCEGWGASYDTGGGAVSGYANAASGVVNVVAGPLSAGAACMGGNITACTFAHTNAVVGRCLRVRHDYDPSSDSEFAYEVSVSITNECGVPINVLRYQRSMDWDIEPNAFNEKVILEPGNAVDLECLHDDGFCSGDPEDASCNGIAVGCAPSGGGEVDSGTTDHGATFRFKFSDITPGTPLLPGDTKSFKTYYGAHFSEAGARAELAAIGVEAFSLGVYQASPRHPIAGPTHFFGFGDIGGSIVTVDCYKAPCECEAVSVVSDSNSVKLQFETEGPYDVECGDV